MNDLSDALTLPRFSELKPERLEPELERVLADYLATVEAVIARGSDRFAETWLPVEQAENAIDALWSSIDHMKSVADSPALRAAHSAGQARMVEVMTGVMQNRQLYDLVVALSESPEFVTLPEADRAAVKRRIQSFTLSGVGLEPEARARFAELSIELSKVANEFVSAVVDATDAWSEHVTDETVLAGIPEPMKAMLASAARAKGLEQGWLVTLQFPSVNAVMTFATNRDLRQRVYTASGTRASDQGPLAGQFDNGPRIARILELRRELATLLGFADPVEHSLATKMAQSGGDVLRFLRDLAARAKPRAEREIAEVREFGAEKFGIIPLEPWDVAFVSNDLRQTRYAVDEQEVRAYLPADRVMEGWQTLLGRLFGIALRRREDVDLWHEDACYYDVLDADGTVFSGLYVDLFAREGKQGGAWMAPARPRLQSGNAIGLPVAYLTCNFAPASDGAPSLLSHDDVQTLLHETGHCLQHLFTLVDRPSVAGIRGFEWDAIELPSQLMEDFAWDYEVLAAMSGHYQTGEKLPRALFDRMLAIRQFQSGLFVVRQLEFGLFDILLHLGTLGSDPMEVIQAARDEVAVIQPPAWHRFPHSFTHVFSGGYAAGYYSYLWAEVMAADGFGKFAEAGLVDRATGDMFRREVLARGATRPAADSFRAFRGRDADLEALLVRRGLMA